MSGFKIGKRISDGAFGSVYEAVVTDPNLQEKFPQPLAIKQVYSSSKHLARQLDIIRRLPKHPHIIQTHHCFEENFMTNIVMERGHYDLSGWISQNYYPIPEAATKNIAFQLLSGIQAVHRQGFVHRDLKPSNVVIRQNGRVAICDFGSAVEASKGEQYELEGFTRWYKCPQMLFGERRYKYEADIWSIGCILMEVAAGQPLFNGKSEIEMLALIAHFIGDPSPENWPSVANMPDFNKIKFKPIKPKSAQEVAKEWSISPQLSLFLLKMLRYEGRASAEELLKDQYLAGIEGEQRIDKYIPEVRAQQKKLLDEAKKRKLF